MTLRFRRGDCVIYRKQKFSACPSPQARDIYPTPNGDCYCYAIDKFWTVVAVRPNGRIVVTTRRGKHVELNADDPALSRAHWLTRFWFRDRFPVLSIDAGQTASAP